MDALLRWAGIGNINPQVHLLAPQSGTKVLEDYGSRLLFDEWFPDRAYLNNLCPEREIEFVRNHPELCPQCYFIPNERVARRDLVEIRELAVLLLNVTPGIAPFIQRTEPSTLDLIRRWIARCVDEGLPRPSGTGFFAILSEDNHPFVRVLLAELAENPRLTEMHRSFLRFWSATLDLTVSSGDEEETADNGTHPDETDPGLDPTPVVTRQWALETLGHDVHPCLEEWNQHGRWVWPANRTVHYLFVADGGQVQVHELSPTAAAVLLACDGSHTISDLYALVENLSDPETQQLREAMGTASLIGGVLGGLREVAGLKLVSTDQE